MRKLITLIFMLLFVSSVMAQSADDIRWGRDVTSNMSSNTLKRWVEGVDARLGSSFEIGPVNIWYVDSNVGSEGDGTSWANARNTLDEAINLADPCDIIYIAEGHAETISAADGFDVDQAGIRIVGMGNGDSRPTFTFTATGSEVAIGNSGVVLYNLRFLAGVSNVTIGISVEADGDDFSIINCEFPKPGTNTYDFAKMIDLASGANDGLILGCQFFTDDAGADTDSDYVIFFGNGAIDGLQIIGNTIIGDFTVAPIWSDQANDEIIIAGNKVINTTTGQMCIEVTSNSCKGFIYDNYCYGDTAAAVIDPGGTFAYNNYECLAIDTHAIPEWGIYSGLDHLVLTADGTAAYPASVADDSILAMLMSKSATATASDYSNTTDSLQAIADHVQNLYITGAGTGDYPTGVTNESIIAFILAKGATATASTYNNQTDSLEAIRDHLDGTTVLAGIELDHLFAAESDDPADSSVLAKLAASDSDWSGFDPTTDSLEAISDAIAGLSGVGFRGTGENNAVTTTVISGDLAGFGNDYFNTGWNLICLYNASGAGTTCEGEIRDITDYVTATGTFTVSPAFSEAVTTSDKVMVVRKEDLNLEDSTILGSMGTVWYCDDGGSNGDGKTWGTAKTTIKAAEALASAGDVILVGQNHNENIVAADAVTFNVAGLTVIGMGEGNARPLLDMDDDGDCITLDAAGITIKNIRFRPGVTDCDSAIRVEDEALGATIENCAFIDGEAAGTDEFVDVIQLDTSASGVTIKNCTYVSSGGGCNNFVDLEEATIADCSVIGCSVYAPMAEAGIYAGAAVPTNVLIQDNIICNGTSGQFAIEFQGNATGKIIDNRLYSDAYATILDPGLCYCAGNMAVDSSDEAAIPIPLSATTDDVTEDDDGSDFERLEYLQNKVEDILAGIRMAGGSVGDVYYVDDGGSGGAATTWATAETTLDAAVADCTANVGDIIFVAPGHDEDLGAATVAVDVAGITIIGIGEGAEQPEIVFNNAASSIVVTAAGCTIKNLKLYSTAAATTIGVDVDADSFTMEDCLMVDTGDFEFSICVDLGATAENATIRNCDFISTTGTTGATSCIAITGGVIDRLIIEGCRIIGDFDNAGIYSTQINTNALIANNVITNLESGDHAIELSAAMTGDLVNNMLYGDTIGSVLDPGSMRCYNNKQGRGADTGALPVPLIAGETYSTKFTSNTVASDDAWVVSGGPIMITQLVGVIKTVYDGAYTLTWWIDATTAAEDHEFTTSVDIDAYTVGDYMTFTAANPAVITDLAGAGANIGAGSPMYPWFCTEGTIEILAEGVAATEGVVDWYMTFIPLVDGVVVVPQ